MEANWMTVVGAGVTLGFKHALEADHVAAVAVLASERRTLWGAALVGAFWGFGHTVALLGAGVWVLALGLHLPEDMVPYLELVVAVVLISLGFRGVLRWLRSDHLHVHTHRHGARVHVHPHLHTRAGQHSAKPFHHGEARLRPFLVGLLHGLAGSAALFLFLLASQPAPWLAWAYLLAFGLASIGGMALLSWLTCLPLQLTAMRFHSLYRALQLTAAVLSLVVGFGLATELLRA